MQGFESVLKDFLDAANRELELGRVITANCYVYCYNRLSLEVEYDRMLLLSHDKVNRTWHIFNLHKSDYYRRIFNA